MTYWEKLNNKGKWILDIICMTRIRYIAVYVNITYISISYIATLIKFLFYSHCLIARLHAKFITKIIALWVNVIDTELHDITITQFLAQTISFMRM